MLCFETCQLHLETTIVQHECCILKLASCIVKLRRWYCIETGQRTMNSERKYMNDHDHDVIAPPHLIPTPPSCESPKLRQFWKISFQIR
jgi:hypothetical protein